MRETFLAFESHFDEKDVLPRMTQCLDSRVRDRKAECADVVACLHLSGVPLGPYVEFVYETVSAACSKCT